MHQSQAKQYKPNKKQALQVSSLLSSNDGCIVTFPAGYVRYRRSANENSEKRRCIGFGMNDDNQAEADFALALSLQEQFENEAEVVVSKETMPNTHSYQRSIVDSSWEVVDPAPNIHQLFVDFDAMFFKSALVNSGVEVKWSHRMTLLSVYRDDFALVTFTRASPRIPVGVQVCARTKGEAGFALLG